MEQGGRLMGGKGSGRRKGHPPSSRSSSAANVDPEFNVRNIEFGKELFVQELVDVSDPDALQERFFWVLGKCAEYGIKPGVENVAFGMGLNRKSFYNLAHGVTKSTQGSDKVTPESVAVLKKIYEFLNNSLANHIADEARNPAKWIFLAKNNFGYRDQTEQVVHHVQPPALDSASDVASRYAKLLGQAEIVDVEDVEDDA